MKFKSTGIQHFFSNLSVQVSSSEKSGAANENHHTPEVKGQEGHASSSTGMLTSETEEKKGHDTIGEEQKKGRSHDSTTDKTTECQEASKQKVGQKTQVFNVVILDRSGSMDVIRTAAVSGFNETLQTIRAAQKKFHDSQEHFVSLIAFNSESITGIYDSVPVDKVDDLRLLDYRPYGCTPLYDAMGETICQLSKITDPIEDVAVFVTVITDGLENCSKEFDGPAIRKMVEAAREKGWTFTYMGANQDAVEVSMQLSIRNARNFEYDDNGTRECMAKDRNTRMNFFSRLHRFKADEEACGNDLSAEERRRNYAHLADEAFDEEELNV